MHETAKIELVKPESLELHPDAGEVLVMSADQYKEFLAAVKKAGVIHEPLKRLKGTRTVIDGRHRRQAAIDAGFALVPVIDIDLGDEDPVLYMLSSATHRRHFTPGQRAAQGAKYLARLKKVARERQREGGRKGGQTAGNGRQKEPSRVVAEGTQPKSDPKPPPPKSRDEAARLSGSSPKAVTAATKIAEKAPAVFDQLAAGKIELPEAKKAAGIAPAKKKADLVEQFDRPLSQVADFPAPLAAALELIGIRTEVSLSMRVSTSGKGSHEERIRNVLATAPGTHEAEVERGVNAMLNFLYPSRKKKQQGAVPTELPASRSKNTAEEELEDLGLLPKKEPPAGVLPCPFCGSSKVEEKPLLPSMRAMQCRECFARGPEAAEPSVARERWNKRPTKAKGGVS
jgi:hypothetical protein